MTKPRRNSPSEVWFAIAPRFLLLDLAGPMQVFASARDPRGRPLYACRIVAAEPGPVRSACGAELSAAPLDPPPEGATIVAPGGPGARAEARRGRLAPWLRAADARGLRIASVCTGAFVLAAAGLLDGRRASTHWRHAETLARAYPRIAVEPDALFVEDGRIWTSAGVTAGIDLALALLERDHGSALALDVARELVVFFKRPGGQAQHSAALRDQAAARDAGLRGLLEAVVADPGLDWRLSALAERAGTSERTLLRRCRAELNATPAKLVEQIRIEAAARMIESGVPPAEAGPRVGLANADVFARAFKRQFGVTPPAWRARFTPRR